MPAKLLSLTEAAAICGVSQKTIRRRISDGTLPAVRVGPKLVKIRTTDLDALVRPIPAAVAS